MAPISEPPGASELASPRLAIWLCVLILFLIPLLPLRDAVFAGKTIGPWNRVAPMVPTSGAAATVPADEPPYDVLQMDACLQFYPWRDAVFASWRQGEIPTWNPYQFTGAPLLENSQSGALYPLHILAGRSGLSTSFLITVLAWFHLFWAGLGVFFLARTLGATNAGALIGGASFAISPAMLAWVGLASVITTVAWLPWIAFAIARLSPGPPREIAMGILGLAGATAMMLLGGHLQFAFYGLFAAGAIGVWRVLSADKKLLVAAAVAGGLIIGYALATPQLGAARDFAQFSHRANTPSEEGYRAYAAAAWSPREMIARLVNPIGMGSPDESRGGLSAFYPAYQRPGANYAETAWSLGPVGLLFLAMAFATGESRRRAIPAIGIGVLGVLLAMDTPLTRALYFGLPGFSASGSPARAGFLFVFAGCTLLALGIPRAAEWGRSQKIAASVAGLIFLLGYVLGTSPGPTPSGLTEAAWRELSAVSSLGWLGWSQCLILLVAATLGVSLRHKLGVWFEIGLIALILLLPRPDIPSGEIPIFPDSLRPSEGQRIAFVGGKWSLFQQPATVMPPNLATIYRLRDVAGYDSLIHRDTVGWMQVLGGTNPSPPENGNMMRTRTADPARLAQLGVSQLVGVARTSQPISNAAPFVSLSGGSAKLVREGYGIIELEVSGGGVLTLLEQGLPGWSASEGSVTPGRWITVNLTNTPRTRRLFLRYRPHSWASLSLFYAGLGTSVVLLIGSAMLGRLGSMRSR